LFVIILTSGIDIREKLARLPELTTPELLSLGLGRS
jgi:hypothetical protein